MSKPRLALIISSTVLMFCLCGFAVWWKLNDRSLFEAYFGRQLAALQTPHPEPLKDAERQRLLGRLIYGRPAERVEAANELAAYRDAEAVTALIISMRDSRGTRRPCQIAHALGKIGHPAALDALEEALHHPANTDLRVCAAIAIGEIGHPRPLNLLLARINNPQLPQSDQTAALFAIWNIADTSSLPALQALSNRHPDETIRELAVAAAREIRILTREEPVPALLNELVLNAPWSREDWVCRQIGLYWNTRKTGSQVNAFLREHDDLRSTQMARLGALLTHADAWEAETIRHLQLSTRKEHRWLSQLAFPEKRQNEPANRRYGSLFFLADSV